MTQFEYLLFSIAAILIIAQPLFIRAFGFSALVICISLLIIAGIAARPRIITVPKVLLILIPIIQIMAGIAFGAELRFLSYLAFLVLISLYFDQFLPIKKIIRLWDLIALACLTVTIIGIFRFFLGYTPSSQAIQEFAAETVSENQVGALGAINQYIYLGISYLPSTRNSDAFYFGIASLVFFSGVYGKHPTSSFKRIFLLSGLAVSAFAVIFSLSRGVWISAMLSVALTYGLRISLRVVLAAVIVLLFASFMLSEQTLSENFLIFLVTTGFNSIFDPETANSSVAGFYTYSNDQRLDIYSLAISDVISSPLGNGIQFKPSYSLLTGVSSVHSENIYLDILIVSGIFGLFIIFSFLQKCWKAYQTRARSLTVGTSCLFFCAFYSIFNSGLDFAPLWFVATVSVLTINARTTPPNGHPSRPRP